MARNRKVNMTTYRIDCPVFSGNAHGGRGHIIAVQVTGPTMVSLRQLVQEVRSRIAAGDYYYTVSPSTSLRATVEAYNCWCGVQTIRTKADAVHDNNLDNMRVCNWKAA
jgi:hypothetical protein